MGNEGSQTKTQNTNDPDEFLQQSERSPNKVKEKKSKKDGGEEDVVALYPYCGRGDGELSFKKGDRFQVLNKSDEEWWYCRGVSQNKKGFVSCSYVVCSTSLEAQEWYFGKVSRKTAERYLRDPALEHGTYFVRESSSGHGYSLSLKSQSGSVRHHKIKTDSDGHFYMEMTLSFPALHDLLSYYREVHPPARTKLLHAVCPKPEPKSWDLSLDTKQNWEIDRDDITCCRRLGEGHFGEVWQGQWKNTYEVAIKTLKEGSMTVTAFLEEASIMKKLRHPNILILYAVCTREEPILIVTEYMNKGSLLSVLRAEGESMIIDELIGICAEVASGMAYLEENSFIHRDLAARTVLMDSSKPCKLTDFRLTRQVDDTYNSISDRVIPVKWTAPEAITHACYTIKSDVWSFGILMMEVITLGGVPYPKIRSRDIMRALSSGYRMPQPSGCPGQLYQLMVSCWKHEPRDRLSFKYLEETLSNFAVTTETSYDKPELDEL